MPPTQCTQCAGCSVQGDVSPVCTNYMSGHWALNVRIGGCNFGSHCFRGIGHYGIQAHLEKSSMLQPVVPLVLPLGWVWGIIW